LPQRFGYRARVTGIALKGTVRVIFYWTTVTAFVSLTVLSLALDWNKYKLYESDPADESVQEKLNRILDLLGVIISDQEHLDADVSALVAAAAAISDEISALKAQPAAASVDFTGLDRVVGTFQGLVPAPAAPVVDPVAPVDPAQA